MRKPTTLPPGSSLGNFTGVGQGVGDLQDGFFLRRARVVADGTIYQTIEFKIEMDFENYNSLLFDESYVGIKDLPIVDAVRIGQSHVPFGLEAYTSSRYLPLLERSPSFDAFYQEFAPGVFVNTTFLDQRITTQQMFHRIDYFNQFNGASFGDGRYAFTARVSGLPIYEDDGRYLLHLGMSYQFRNGSTPGDFNGERHRVHCRTRLSRPAPSWSAFGAGQAFAMRSDCKASPPASWIPETSLPTTCKGLTESFFATRVPPGYKPNGP